MKRLVTVIMSCIMVVGCFGMVASAEELGLDDATKQAYYEEYIQIAKEVGKEAEVDISVLPMSEFTEEDWRTPEEFRSIITTIANWNIVCTAENGIQPYSTASATKTATVTAEGKNYTLSITGSFETALNTSTGRQHFSKINSITSKISGYTGTWTQTGYEATAIDAARTYAVTVSGELSIAGAEFPNKLVYVEFYCSATGVVG